MLESPAFEQPGLFVEKGIDLEVRGIRRALDSGSEFPAHCAHSMAEVTCPPRHMFRGRSARISFEKMTTGEQNLYSAQTALKPLPQALVSLLASLSIPVVPERVCRAASEAGDAVDMGARVRSFTADLPPVHRDVLVYLVRYARCSRRFLTRTRTCSLYCLGGHYRTERLTRKGRWRKTG